MVSGSRISEKCPSKSHWEKWDVSQLLWGQSHSLCALPPVSSSKWCPWMSAQVAAEIVSIIKYILKICSFAVVSLSLYFCVSNSVGSRRRFSLTVKSHNWGELGTNAKGLGYWWSLGLHFCSEVSQRGGGDWAQVMTGVVCVLPGVVLAPYSRAVPGMLQSRLVYRGPGTLLLKKLWQGCAALQYWRLWLLGERRAQSNHPWDKRTDFGGLHLLVCIHLWNQEWNFQERRRRGQRLSKHSEKST